MIATGSGLAPLLDRLAVLLEAGVAPPAAWAHLARATRSGSDRRVVAGMAEALAEGRPGAPALVEVALHAEAVAPRDASPVVRLLRGLSSAPTWARRILGVAAPGAVATPGVPGAGPGDAALADAAVPCPSAVTAAEWRQVAAAWSVAEESGAPLAACLRATADAARAAQQSRRDQAVALSGPVSTARVVLALPVVGLLMGLLLGFDTLAVLIGRPVGWFCLVGAGGLVSAARAWNARLVRRATPSDAVPGLDLELLAVALSGGGSWTSARSRVDRALSEFCVGSHARSPAVEIDTLVDLSEGAGVPAAGLLRAAADECRRDARARSAVAAERLGIALMLPLGVCILPAFLLVGVVPLFVALLSSTGFGAA
ncbi:hypothetical protein AS850_10560 [Frondihabitans sp. 762G35]|uniref:type II secretion system F family protein n=1 Tax=Frondihabitans sp. 762G35 TaxID=1446794 RepID=UPI000D218DC3|nr:type II secretion system F family protein [Frondihabitans sp. 762G35]ARC57517.1 hypothetical protein AS850_10560 [Frondihabitans sp. 762G35]